MRDSASPARRPPVRQPIFNVPQVVAALVVALVAIHAVRVLLLSSAAEQWVVVAFAFVPWRETASAAALAGFPGGVGAKAWSLFTYAFLHANWTHLIVNSLWLLAFGSPLAWRFGAARFLGFSLVGAIMGAAMHWAVYPHQVVPMVGASAAISAHMAGASRFVFAVGGPLMRAHSPSVYRLPAPPLGVVIRDPRVLIFVGVWFGVNLLFGLGGVGAGIASGAIAWDAHIGGFVAGLLLFPLFDPVPAQRR